MKGFEGLKRLGGVKTGSGGRFVRVGPPASASAPSNKRGYATKSGYGYVTPSSKRGYATATSVEKKRVALIGARGYTGQTLVGMLDKHPHLELTHVSSRQMVGMPLEGYTKCVSFD